MDLTIIPLERSVNKPANPYATGFYGGSKRVGVGYLRTWGSTHSTALYWSIRFAPERS